MDSIKSLDGLLSEVNGQRPMAASHAHDAEVAHFSGLWMP